MSFRNLSNAILAAALTVGVFGSADATPSLTPNGSFAAEDGGAITANGVTQGGNWQLGTSTTVITLSGTEVVTSASDPYNGTSNDLLSANGGLINVTGSLFSDPQFTLPSGYSLNVTSGSITPFTLILSGYTFTFDAEEVTSDINGAVSLAFLGDLTGDTSGLLVTPASADFSASFTESSPTGSIGASFSIDTPPNPTLTDTPEPATMAILSVGLMGLGAARCRKR